VPEPAEAQPPARPKRGRAKASGGGTQRAAGATQKAAGATQKAAGATQKARGAEAARKVAGTVTAAGAAEALERAAEAAATARAGVEDAQRRAAEAAATARAGVEDAQRRAAEETLPREVAVARGRPLLNLAIGGVAGFGLIYAIVKLRWSGAFDVAVTRALQSIRAPVFAALMRAVSWPGFPPQSRAITPLASGVMAILGYPLEAAFQVLAWGTGLISTVTKALMKRPRPTEPDVRVVVAPLGGSSFPSGHVITYMGVYGFLAYLAHTLIRPVALRRALVGLFGGLLALVGPSRIYQGHHWPTDVIASYLLGTSYLIGVTTLYRKLKATLAPRLSEPTGSARAEVDRKREAANEGASDSASRS
jgi:membrane-associated phospholipid phosphatase